MGLCIRQTWHWLLLIALALCTATPVLAAEPVHCPLPAEATPLAALTDGQQKMDPANYFLMGDKTLALPLRGVFAPVEALGLTPWTAMRTHTLAGEAAFGLLVVPKDGQLTENDGIEGAAFVVVACRQGAWQVLGKPFQFAGDDASRLSGVEPVQLPDGAEAWLARIFIGQPRLMEFYEELFLIGPAGKGHLTARKGETWGDLAHGEVARQTIAMSDGDRPPPEPYVRSDLVTGSGLLPYDGGQVFVALTVFSDSPKGWVLGTPLAIDRIGPRGDGANNLPGWIYTGTGPLPDVCTGLTTVRCRAVDVAQVRQRWGEPPYTWFAGVWLEAKDAAAGVKEAKLPAGGTWYWLGGADEMPKKDPSGKPTRTVAKFGKLKKPAR